MQNRSDQAGVKVNYTTQEVLELGIPFSKSMPESKTCKFCGKTLYHEGLVFNGSVILWQSDPQRCNCPEAVAYWQRRDIEQKQKEAESEQAEKRKIMNRRVEALTGQSGIKKRFLTRTFENYKVNAKNQRAFETAKKYVADFEKCDGRGIYFEGTCGTGKTHLAVAIALELLGRGIPVICKTSIDLLADIKRSYDGKYDEYQILDVYKTVDLLIIDDLGKEQVTDWSMPMLYSILNDRYEQTRPTIITTNYNEEMLKERLTLKNGDKLSAEAIISRFRECNDIVTMAWGDFRGGA